jgi:hypothetical protein
MRSRCIAIIAAGILLAILPSTARSEEDPGAKHGPALERIRAQVQKMQAEGKSDIEILEAMRGMIDRALAQREGGEKVRKEKEPAGAAPAVKPAVVKPVRPVPQKQPEKPAAAPRLKAPGAQPRIQEKIKPVPAAEKPCACPLCPHNRAKQDRSLQVQERIQAAARKMRAEGKSPEEIQAAVQKMKERARQALEKEAAKPVPPAVRKKGEIIEKKPGQPLRLEKAPPLPPKLPQKAPIKSGKIGEL